MSIELAGTVKADNGSSISAMTQDLLKKKDLTLNEALLVMRHCEEKIKKASVNRLDAPKTPSTKYLVDGDKFKISGVLGIFSSLLGTLPLAAFLEVQGAIAGASGIVASCMVVGLGIKLDSYQGADDGILLRSRRKKNLSVLEQKFEASKRLYELKEQEYLKTVKKVSKPALRAINVINANLDDEVIIYEGTKGKEGFIRQPKYVPVKDTWEELATTLPNSDEFGKLKEAPVDVAGSFSVELKKAKELTK